MQQQLLWLTLSTAGLLTFGVRLSFLVLLEKTPIPSLLRQALRFVPVAVLSALISPALFLPRGELDISLWNSRLLAGLFATLVAWRTKNALLTIASGMLCLFVLQAFMPAR